jgi:ABC-type nitrate/sulfonate/bicarbonate transport system substrate-binding protein
MSLRIAVPDLVSPSYFPAIAAVELGLFKSEGLDATLELVFPVTRAYQELRAGRLDLVAGAAHAPLYVFQDWSGARLLCALAQHMYWFLVLRSDLGVTRGDLRAVRGLRIGAAPGPVDGLRRMLREVDIDPERDVKIGPVPAAAGAGVSFGVAAANALAAGEIDGFWANGMGAEIAVKSGTGTLVIDARRGDGPPGVRHYTFPALIATEQTIASAPNLLEAAVRAIISAQRALTEGPERATAVGKKLFPPAEAELIGELIQRDVPYYDAAISVETITALNRFAGDMGILSSHVPYERVVATQFKHLWERR